MSFAVRKPKIAEVLDMVSGRVLSANQAIGADYDAAVVLRSTLKERQFEGRPLYACPPCGVGVQLNCMDKQKQFYFRHVHELGGCPIDTGAHLTRDEIDAIRYNGAKESELHHQMKQWIAQCTEVDPAFTNTEVESSWKGKLTGEMRRPDVRAEHKGMRVAFEVQLSSTYLDVIVGRRLFYRKEGALLVWVFANFDEGIRKMTQDDIYFNNNQNALVVTAETVEASKKHGKFMLDCVWRYPLSATDSSAVSDLQRKLVSFDELTLDLASQTAFYFDFEGAREKLRAAERAAGPNPYFAPVEQPWWYDTDEAEALRERFRDTWLRAIGDGKVPGEEWEELGFRFEEADLKLPAYPHLLPETVLKVLYSFQAGRPVGYKFSSLIQVLHETLPRSDRTRVMPYLEYVGKALRVYGLVPQLRKARNYAAWETKAAEHRAREAERIVDPKPELATVRLIEFLFPRLAGATAKLAASL
ncbi:MULTISPECIES: DUF6035 family protein [unclassified Variovorax]|nr:MULTISPECIES: DUF6035 family protein [unclassified Variovorax]KWT98121.1 hypothetical protein APY03_0792 [Variovorax sp. WDL1]PNG50405.1 hypothetical protein CHC06_06029 [Variovorax sp. B2]PNG51278.1 hypothetical protein CHC07_05935 [Variovorax sp. B4]VTV17525.1 hypothetical protein WDL1P1_00458 [Variovorax sp. WDL1]